ncbi:MAG: hypothetical protein EOO27_20180 [Comamonadaceae bacterium]|nr:MAG: hypothetical protein EOO27_20180 [Comamonadaceae bacterium]
MATKQEKDTKTVYLTKPHRHAGRDYPKGAELELPESKATWLIAMKVASKTPPDTTTVTPKES